MTLVCHSDKKQKSRLTLESLFFLLQKPKLVHWGEKADVSNRVQKNTLLRYSFSFFFGSIHVENIRLWLRDAAALGNY